MDEEVIIAYLVGYLVTIIAVFLYFLPMLVLLVVLLLIVGVPWLLAQPFVALFRKLRRRDS